jgi:deoxyhypusine synthase
VDEGDETAPAASGTSTSTSSCTTLPPETYEGDPEECWLLAAAKANLPIVVPGYEDSTFGNIFAST